MGRKRPVFSNINPHYGPTRNPWARAHIYGGSSGGSAVPGASGLCGAPLGTRTGGSVRIPAAACGCVGLKPTWGLVPLEGVIPLAPTLDHVGPITRCVEDAAIVLSCIAGKDFVRGMRRGVRGMRIGIPRQYYFDHIQDPIRQALCAAVSSLEQAGAEVAEVEWPGMRETAELAADLTVGEALAYHWKWLQKRPGDYGDDLRSRMQAKRGMTVVEYLLCQERRREYANRFEELAKTVGVLAAPTLPITAPRIDADEVLPGGRRETVRNALLGLTDANARRRGEDGTVSTGIVQMANVSMRHLHAQPRCPRDRHAHLRIDLPSMRYAGGTDDGDA